MPLHKYRDRNDWAVLHGVGVDEVGENFSMFFLFIAFPRFRFSLTTLGQGQTTVLSWKWGISLRHCLQRPRSKLPKMRGVSRYFSQVSG